MLSIALFPCSSVDGAGIIGELSNRLALQVYTDNLFCLDVAKRFGLPAEKVKELFYEWTPATERRTLMREKQVNLLTRFLLTKLALPDRRLFYGLHTSLIGPEITHVLRVLVIDSEKGRVRRAMHQERLAESAALRLVRRHDRDVSRWTQFLHRIDAYDHSLYDLIVSCEDRDMLDVVNMIEQSYRERGRMADHVPSREAVADMEITAAVERVLLERGYRADVRTRRGLVTVDVAVSRYHFRRLGAELAELARSVAGVRRADVRNAAVQTSAWPAPAPATATP